MLIKKDPSIQDFRLVLPVHEYKTYKKRDIKTINKIIVHCTASNCRKEEELFRLAEYDIGPNHISSSGCPGITYHFMILPDGRLYYTSDITNITWHAGNFNSKSIAVSLCYKGDNSFVPSPQIESLYKILSELCLDLNIDPDNIKGHRELPGTGYNIVNGIKKLRKVCPGLKINLDNLRYTVSTSVQRTLKGLKYYEDKVDGVFGRKSEIALDRYYKDSMAS